MARKARNPEMLKYFNPDVENTDMFGRSQLGYPVLGRHEQNTDPMLFASDPMQEVDGGSKTRRRPKSKTTKKRRHRSIKKLRRRAKTRTRTRK